MADSRQTPVSMDMRAILQEELLCHIPYQMLGCIFGDIYMSMLISATLCINESQFSHQRLF